MATPGLAVAEQILSYVRMRKKLTYAIKLLQGRITTAAWAGRIAPWGDVVDSIVADTPADAQTIVRDMLERSELGADMMRSARTAAEYARAHGMSPTAARRLIRHNITYESGVAQIIDGELVPHGVTFGTRIDATARTLTTTVHGWSARDEARLTGQELRWVTVGDSRVRPSHRIAQGQTVAPDEPFLVGGFNMMYPGDPAAPPDEVINCRCVAYLVGEPRRLPASVPRDWLTAAAPSQARAPKGTPIGGQWIDTPLTIMDKIDMRREGIPIPDEGPYPTPQAIADEYGRRLEEAWGDPNLEVTINGVSGGDEYGTKMMGVITDKQGNRVGDFERTLYADGHVSNDQFRLVPEYQGKGMGSKMTTASDDFYRELGYDRVELKAGLDVGGYTWAKQGFEFEGQLTAYDVAYHAHDTIMRMPGVSDDVKRQAGDIFARAQAEAEAAGDADSSYLPTGILPVEIAMIGWTPGATTWPGKEALLGYEWYGVKHLNKSVTAASVSDQAAAIAAVHRAWVPTARYESTPVPYGARSWYPATEEDVNTNPDSDAVFWAQVADILTPQALTAAAPNQARAPKGTPIGGQWIDTPNAILANLGYAGEGEGAIDQAYTVPETNPTEYPDGIEGLPSPNDPAYFTADQEAALNEYTGPFGLVINQFLRAGSVPSAKTDMLDSAFDSSQLAEDTTLWRRVPASALPTEDFNLDAITGSVMRDHAYLSTSTDPENYGDWRDPRLRITVPAGTPAIDMRPISKIPWEDEVLLPRDLPLAITGWEFDENDVPIIDVTVATAESLTAAAPNQARAPKGVPIGGQWIDTPNAILTLLGYPDEDIMFGKPVAYDVPDVNGQEYPDGIKGMPSPTNVDTFTDEERDALRNYTGDYAKEVNGNLRYGVAGEAQVRDIDSAMAKSTLADDTILYRRVPDDAMPMEADELDGIVGSVVRDRAYLSTSTDPDAYAPSMGWPVLVINAPAGTHGLDMRDISNLPDEYEVMLDRDLPLAITGWEYGDDDVPYIYVTVAEEAAMAAAALTAAAPNQARAPKGTPIGGQWIDTPGGLLGDVGGFGGGGGGGDGEGDDDGLSINIGGSTYTGTRAAPHGREDDIRAHGGTTPPLYHSKGDPESSQAFQNAIQASKDGNKYGASVYVYDADEYQDMDLWLTSDGKAGIALHDDEIVSAFNNSPDPANKGFVQHAMAQAQAAGGTRADAYDTVLPKLYAEAGMEVVARVPWDDEFAPDDWDYDTFAKFNGGRPDVVFLKLNKDGWWGVYTPGQGVQVVSYEEGQALTASAAVGEALVDGVVVPFGGAGVGDRFGGGVDAVGAESSFDERVAVSFSPVHAGTVHPKAVHNPGSRRGGW